VSAWLRPLRDVLDLAPEPVTFFVRDDDAGWRDDRLTALLDVFARHDAPIDLAAIPLDVTPDLARALVARIEAGEAVGIHQHGYAHTNHQVEGRKCEFGSDRTAEAQRTDIEDGQRRLRALFGAALQPIFTPPWNRCTEDTGASLVALGIGVLSRDRTATPLGLDGLRELPVQVDWFAKRKGVPLGRDAVGEQMAARALEPAPVGVMLHHAEMDTEDMNAMDELLALIAGHDRARCLPMAAVLAETAVESAA
jgi:peptidoglycan/xylan/chitin deacetylase (PgdA/CDA1 family)